jgi:ribosomal protein S6
MEEENKVVEAEEVEVEAVEGDGSIYEIGYLFVPTIPEDAILGKFSELKSYLEKKGATFIQEELPKMMTLAYEMNRTIANKKTWFSTAYFGFIKFEIEGSTIDLINKELSRNEDLIRFLIISTVRENTMIGKKLQRNGERRPRAVKEDGTPVPEVVLSEEQIDAEIDAMVADEELPKTDETVVQ